MVLELRECPSLEQFALQDPNDLAIQRFLHLRLSPSPVVGGHPLFATDTDLVCTVCCLCVDVWFRSITSETKYR